MRILGLALLLAGCVGPPAGPNASADKAPPQTPAPSGPGANAFRAAIEANEERFRFNSVARLGEEVRIDGVGIRPLEVVEDSRCPVDATCVWAGRLRLRVQVSVSGGSTEGTIEIDRPVAIVAGAGRVELKDPHDDPRAQQLVLAAVAPLNWAHPPAGEDPRMPKRFAFYLID